MVSLFPRGLPARQCSGALGRYREAGIAVRHVLPLQKNHQLVSPIRHRSFKKMTCKYGNINNSIAKWRQIKIDYIDAVE